MRQLQKVIFCGIRLELGMLAAATMLFTVIVAHLSGEKAGGLFSFALTIGQWIGTIAYFELRTFQVTDVARRHSYAEYFYAKVFCCILAVLAGWRLYNAPWRHSGEGFLYLSALHL